jgi:hypothetical protein
MERLNEEIRDKERTMKVNLVIHKIWISLFLQIEYSSMNRLICQDEH